LANVGASGDVWSSSTYASGNINAGDLYFTAGNANPLNNPNRANGLSVRCVQHLPELLLSEHRTFFDFSVCKANSLPTRSGGSQGSRQCGPQIQRSTDACR